jgi:hypothetical protein
MTFSSSSPCAGQVPLRIILTCARGYGLFNPDPTPKLGQKFIKNYIKGRKNILQGRTYVMKDEIEIDQL